MKWAKNILWVILIAVGFGSYIWFATAQAAPIITEPPSGALIKNRLDFPVAWAIDTFDKDRAANWHYWVSIASVKGNNNELDLHWPKFYVKAGQAQGRVSDGGQNPFPYPQPMVILLLRVDDATNQRFIAWLRRGSSKGGFPGFPVSTTEVVARVPIRFP